MSDRYKGAILSPTAPTVTPQSAGGVYTLSQQTQYQGQGVWPSAFNNPINNSLRFRSSASAYLNRTPASAGNQKTWTFSFWVKRGTISTFQYLYGVGPGANDSTIAFYSDDSLAMYLDDGAGATGLRTTQVFRDPSAWYHIVIAMDTTQATASNRMKMYINGTQVTAFQVASYPNQNTDWQVNTNAYAATIGRGRGGSYSDCYMAEYNFIDGLQLTPSSFGTTDAYGIWQPIPYTGTYGTNGFYLKFTDNSALTTSSNVGLGRDFSGNANYWVTNNISITAGTTYDSMIDVPTNTNSNTANYCVINPLDNATGATITNGNLQVTSSSASWKTVRSTFALSTGSWYVELTSTVGTGNGNSFIGIVPMGVTLPQPVGEGSATSWGYSSNGNIYNNGGVIVATGASWSAGTTVAMTFDGSTLRFYRAGTLVGTVSSIPANTYAVGGSFYDNNAGAFNFGQQPFAYTPPTGFYPLNTYNLPTPTILAGNQYFDTTTFTAPIGIGGNGGGRNGGNSGGGGQGAGFSGVLSSSGTQLVIAAGGGGGGGGGGFGGGNNGGAATAGGAGSGSGGSGYSGSVTGGSMTNGSGGGGGGGSDAGSGTSGGGAGGTNVLTGTNTTSTNGSGTSVANSGDPNYVANRGNGGATSSTGTSSINQGQNGLVWIQYPATGGTTATYSSAAETLFTVPSGITSLRVKAWGAGGSSGFGAVSATGGAGGGGGFAQADITVTPGQVLTIVVGTGGRQYGSKSITNAASFQPDFVWFKDRTSAYDHILTDSVRGVNNSLVSNSTNAESSTTLYLLSAFNSNGFNVSSIADAATLNDSLVGWQWRASNVAGVSNTQGTITSTVSANTTAGFSVVTYTGTGSAATIGHGLGVAPSMIIVKPRGATVTTDAWNVYHVSLGNTQFLVLNATDAAVTATNRWNSTSPTSSVFTIGTVPSSNAVGYVAYCFSAVSGYSVFGSYTGNGSSDGPFVFTGFRPRFVMFKNATTGSTNWQINDSARDTYNVVNKRLAPSNSDAEATNFDFGDFLSNGFKIRQTDQTWNRNGDTYIYACFAENPFKIARAR